MRWGCLFAVLAGLAMPLAAQDGPKEETKPSVSLASSIRRTVEDEISMKTLGGGQFWGDVVFFHGWHIQQNVFTKHFRLLDEHDQRHAWGSLADCQARLKQIREEQKLPPMKGRGVVLIHGILRSAKCMSSMAETLGQAGFTTFQFNYPSTQVSIPEAAEYLHQTIESLEGIEELNIAAHSMGGLITRAYFAAHHDPRFRRVVMVGTPNHGAELADLVHQNFLVRTAAGPGGRQLVTAREGLIPSLPAPKCEFAIIAGARHNPAGWNPFIPGDDDGTVTVESTRLVGAADFATVQTTHTALLRNRETLELTLRFLSEGCLCADRPARPITSEVETPDNTTVPPPSSP
ncbi:MAG: alpha/beta fold hydrolase [Candidatus Saccharimonas sp.]|nr:alpha/beta fold hydrolase [Planctomycetaceae bacterium]